MAKNETTIIIADPIGDYQEMTPEKLLRPRRTGILQLEVRGDMEYAHYMFNESDPENGAMKEFENYEAFRNSVVRIVRQHLISEGARMTADDMTFEVNNLVDRALSLANNFKLCNLDLREKTAVSLIDELRKARAYLEGREKKFVNA